MTRDLDLYVWLPLSGGKWFERCHYTRRSPPVAGCGCGPCQIVRAELAGGPTFGDRLEAAACAARRIEK